MALYKGDCVTCGMEDVTCYDSDDQCIACHRYDDIEKRLKRLEEKSVHYVSSKKLGSRECPYKTVCDLCGHYIDRKCTLGYNRKRGCDKCHS